MKSHTPIKSCKPIQGKNSFSINAPLSILSCDKTRRSHSNPENDHNRSNDHVIGDNVEFVDTEDKR